MTIEKEPLFTKEKTKWFLIYTLLLTGLLFWAVGGYAAYLHLTGRSVFAESLPVMQRPYTPREIAAAMPTAKEMAEAFRKSLEEPTK
jgi:hypothetical protein